MKAKIVYGCPCSGKSTYIRGHAGDNDIIYDFDALRLAMTTRTQHLTERHIADLLILDLRKAIVDKVKDDKKKLTLSGFSAAGLQIHSRKS